MSDLMRSAMHGVVWPAITDDRAAQALALQFQFEQSQWWPPEQLQAQQLKQFESVFRHAVTTVPYYRERGAMCRMQGLRCTVMRRQLRMARSEALDHQVRWVVPC